MAIAHDYLTQRGGAERVVLALLRAFPEATVHTLLYDPDGTFPEFRDARVVTSPAQPGRPAAPPPPTGAAAAGARRRPG